MPNAAPKSVAVVGGGLTGLVAAWRLHRDGHAVTLFEKHSRVGGSIVTTETDGWVIEGGPNTLQETPEVVALLAELGLEGQRAMVRSAAKQRFIVRGSRLVPVPLSPAGLLVSPLFSFGARLRAFRELFTRPRVRTTDTSLASFVIAHFGREILDYGMNPFAGGIYAGDPEKLSARFAFPQLWRLERTYGSLLRGFRAEARERRDRGESTGVAPLISFDHGLETLPAALAAALPPGTVKTDTAVTNIIPGRPWKIITQRHAAVDTTAFDAVVLALSAGGLGQLVFGTLGERTLASLDHQPHPPVSSLFLGFKRSQVSHPLDGYGALVPACEKKSMLGVVFSSTLFPSRAPDGHVAVTVLAGGARQPETGRLPLDQLLARVLPDLRALLGITGDPVFTHLTFWPKAIPQYNVGHERFLDPLARCEIQYPGLFIGGSPRDGISLPDCVNSGTALARNAAEFVARPSRAT